MNKEQLEKYGNEPATACVGYGNMGDSFYQGGITIREHFAGLAMQSLIANPNINRPKPGINFEYDLKEFSRIAVEYSEALLKALAEKRENDDKPEP